MNAFVYDIMLCLFTYGLMGWITFRLMKSRLKNDGGDDGNNQGTEYPIIDLPPGIVWPSDPDSKDEKEVLETF